jgi:hypothetical protein
MYGAMTVSGGTVPCTVQHRLAPLTPSACCWLALVLQFTPLMADGEQRTVPTTVVVAVAEMACHNHDSVLVVSAADMSVVRRHAQQSMLTVTCVLCLR